MGNALQEQGKLELAINASHVVYYLVKDMFEAHDALMCIGQKTYINDQKRFKLTNNHYFKSSSEMSEIIFVISYG